MTDKDMNLDPTCTDVENETGAAGSACSENLGDTANERGAESSPEAIDEKMLSGLRGSLEPKWYVIHTYSGHEKKVKVNIEKMVENRGMQALIKEVIVPEENRVEISKDGQRKVKPKKMFPGYVLVKMVVTNDSWYLVRNAQGVTGFVGHGLEPVPLSREEVRRIGVETVTIDMDIKEGDLIKVINGPFERNMGVVEAVNAERQTLRAMISIFGRDTPVELEYNQVDKL